jgi:hypothetical protein
MIAARLRPVRPLAPARFFLGACPIIFLSVVAIGITPSDMDGWAALNGMQRIAVFATMATGAVLLAVSMIGQRYLETNTRWTLRCCRLAF